MAIFQDILNGQIALNSNKEKITDLASCARKLNVLSQDIENQIKTILFKHAVEQEFITEIENLRPILFDLKQSINIDLASIISDVNSSLQAVNSAIDSVLDGWEPNQQE